MKKLPKLSFWQIWNLSFGFLGVQIGYSLQNANTSRIFESLGYEVMKLDRTVFAGLNKKDLPRGTWRFLNEKEVVNLKFR